MINKTNFINIIIVLTTIILLTIIYTLYDIAHLDSIDYWTIYKDNNHLIQYRKVSDNEFINIKPDMLASWWKEDVIKQLSCIYGGDWKLYLINDQPMYKYLAERNNNETFYTLNKLWPNYEKFSTRGISYTLMDLPFKVNYLNKIELAHNLILNRENDYLIEQYISKWSESQNFNRIYVSNY